MPDLSQLTDEQLHVYRDLLIEKKKQAAGNTMRQNVPQAFQVVGMRDAGPGKPPVPDYGARNTGEAIENVTINEMYGAPFRAASGLWDTAKALYNDPSGTVRSVVGNAVDHAKNAYNAFRQGQYGTAASEAAAATPIGAIGESADVNHPGRVIGDAALAVLPVMSEGRALVSELKDTARDAGAVTAAVAKGAAKAGGPQLATGAAKVAAGAALDAVEGGHLGTYVGLREGWSDIANGLKSGAKGGQQSLQEFLKNWRMADEVQPRAPITAPPSTVPDLLRRPEAAPAPSPPGALPSGRKPGGIQNQRTPVAEPAAVALEAAKAGDVILPTDTVEIAARKLGTAGKITAKAELEAKLAIKAAQQEAAKASPVLNTPAKVDAAQALADELNKVDVSEPRITASNMFDRPKPGQPKGPRPFPHDDQYNAIVSTSDLNMFARDMGIGEAEAAKTLADRGVLVLDRKALIKGLHDNFPGHQAMSDAALRKFGVKSTKELTDSQFARWYDDVLVAQTEAADKRALKAQRVPAEEAMSKATDIGSESEPLYGLAYDSKYYKKGGKWYESLSWRDPRAQQSIPRGSHGEWKPVSKEDAASIQRMFESGRVAERGAAWPPQMKGAK